MNSLQVEYFLTVCRYMNFTETARVLYVSQPAISKQIAALEKEIGLSLFDRTRRNLQLTSTGEVFRDAFIKMGTVYSDAVNEAKRINAERKGTLTIGILSSWNISKLIPNLRETFLVNFPGIHLSIESYSFNDILLRLEENHLDVAVTYSFGNFNRYNIRSYKINEVNARLFYSAMHPLAKKEDLTLEDFKDETFFFEISEVYEENLQCLISYCETFGFTPKTSVLPNIESTIASIQARLGVTVFDKIHKLGSNPEFKFLDLSYARETCVSWKEDNKHPLVKDFVNMLILIIG